MSKIPIDNGVEAGHEYELISTITIMKVPALERGILSVVGRSACSAPGLPADRREPSARPPAPCRRGIDPTPMAIRVRTADPSPDWSDSNEETLPMSRHSALRSQ